VKLISFKLQDFIIELIDQLVEEGRYPSRSAAIRFAILDLLKREGKL